MIKKSQVFAIKYRPQTFKDLVGHTEISTAIYNSIKFNKIANAFLFTGIRGIGKTTFARIVAKALNCKNGIEKLCQDNFCSNCDAIINSNHIDVLEIDAASRTGVDDVRELIEFSRYSPSLAKYKIFIIDEVHMLSKQAFNALLKTLEEPPPYLKFIFATTEIKKIPVTVISRCQRYELPRINSKELFGYLKNIAKKESKIVEEDALKLIVKISEGSVRDALSLLDRSLISNNNEILTFETVKKIFGYVDKSSYIELLEHILSADERLVFKHYRNLYNSGVEPIDFLNEFLEIIYYLKNINYIKLDGTNFTLNDKEFSKIETLSKMIYPGAVFLMWEFTLKTIKEIRIVSNQNLSVEMFLFQLLYLNKKKINLKNLNDDHNINKTETIEHSSKKKPDVISQIKNIQQEEELTKKKTKDLSNNIQNLNDLIRFCSEKKEMELKYELENNVNLVSFIENRIEISFNEKLSKNFVKNLSEKLFHWTNTRWIISFSKKNGEIIKKQEKKFNKVSTIEEFKKTDEYSKLIKSFPDIEIMDISKK